MQHHLADPAILHFDSKERSNAALGRKKSWKDLQQHVNSKIFGLGSAVGFLFVCLFVFVFWLNFLVSLFSDFF